MLPVRGDLVTAMRDLFLKRVRGDDAAVRTAWCRNKGMADPRR